jgi:hypothetical protein
LWVPRRLVCGWPTCSIRRGARAIPRQAAWILPRVASAPIPLLRLQHNRNPPIPAVRLSWAFPKEQLGRNLSLQDPSCARLARRLRPVVPGLCATGEERRNAIHPLQTIHPGLSSVAGPASCLAGSGLRTSVNLGSIECPIRPTGLQPARARSPTQRSTLSGAGNIGATDTRSQLVSLGERGQVRAPAPPPCWPVHRTTAVCPGWRTDRL